MERLLIDKQKSTLYQVSLLLNRFRHEIDFQPLSKLIANLETNLNANLETGLAETYKEFQKLKTEVEQLEDSQLEKDSLKLKREVLEYIWAKTPIQARSEEEKKNEPRGRPLFTLDDAKKETESNEKKRDLK
jgi:hypothetical protein